MPFWALLLAALAGFILGIAAGIYRAALRAFAAALVARITLLGHASTWIHLGHAIVQRDAGQHCSGEHVTPWRGTPIVTARQVKELTA